MRVVRVVEEVALSRTFDLTVSEHHTVALANGLIVSNCDTHCVGKRCGACTNDDYRHRATYIRAAQSERDVDIPTLAVIDQRSQTVRVRARIHKPAHYRFVGVDHWRFAVRRAAYRAQADLPSFPGGIAKRSIRFASEAAKHRDWTAGVDYIEFALTRPVEPDQLLQYSQRLNEHLRPWLALSEAQIYPRDLRGLQADVDTRYYEMEVDSDLPALQAYLDAWQAAETVPMRITVVGGSYFAPTAETVNAKDHVEDLWHVQDGYRLKLHMLLRGRVSPYEICAALASKPSWIDAAEHLAVRRDVFVRSDRYQTQIFRSGCQGCGRSIPVNPLGQEFSPHHCPRCASETRTATPVCP